MIRLDVRCWMTPDGRLVIRIEEMRQLDTEAMNKLQPRTEVYIVKYQVMLNLCGDGGVTALNDTVVDTLDLAVATAQSWAKKIADAREDG